MSKQDTQWIGSSDVLPMFPTPVWKAQLKADFHEAMDAKVVAAVQRLREGTLPSQPAKDGNHTRSCTSSGRISGPRVVHRGFAVIRIPSEKNDWKFLDNFS